MVKERITHHLFMRSLKPSPSQGLLITSLLINSMGGAGIHGGAGILGGPVVRTLHCKKHEFDPWLGS